MNEVAVASSESFLHRLIEHNPGLGILASFTGFGSTLLAAIHALSIIVGFAGAIFGCIAGYYTMRCHYRKWQKLKSDK